MSAHARFALSWTLASLALAGCTPPPQEASQGTDVEPTAFGRGVVTVNEDATYASTNVSLVGLDGARLSESFISSASGISGDVAAPTMPVTGDDIVLLDRSTSIVTWVDVRSAEVRTQYHCDADELARNPWDYLPIADNKAYLTRYDALPERGDHGDITVVDPAKVDLRSGVRQRIDVAAALDLAADDRAHPARGVVAGERAYVTVVIATSAYEYRSSYLIMLDTGTDEIVASHRIDDLHDCTSIALSPSRSEIAVACSGDLMADGTLDPKRAGVVLLSSADLAEKGRFAAGELGAGIPGFALSYASEGTLIATMLGNLDASIDDKVIELDTGSGKTRKVYSAAPFQIGAVLCPVRVDGETAKGLDPPACFVTDAEKGVLLRYPVEKGSLGEAASIVVDESIGLPPRYLGQF